MYKIDDIIDMINSYNGLKDVVSYFSTNDICNISLKDYFENEIKTLEISGNIKETVKFELTSKLLDLQVKLQSIEDKLKDSDEGICKSIEDLINVYKVWKNNSIFIEKYIAYTEDNENISIKFEDTKNNSEEIFSISDLSKIKPNLDLIIKYSNAIKDVNQELLKIIDDTLEYIG